MIKAKNVKLIWVGEWDKLVSDTYGKPYNFQQQEGCKSRGIFKFEVPSDYTEDDEMNDDVPEQINGDIMGVKFEKWLERSPQEPVDGRTDYGVGLWWSRNFYPDVYTVILETGDYVIEIDW
jgi:hypothetical protein